MSYKALYRVFRPKNFDEVVGQKHIVTVLKNQIKSGHISHAYLFTGSRGTGKTSIAKIFARAICCNHTVDGDACRKCALCIESLKDNSVDIIEIDAASNNGVDEIRQLRENVKYSPVSGKMKVYIIDEVHMLSGGAFNALLKTLEEPPSHVVFVLATTEPQKLPDTIISRCQRYDFNKIDQKDIEDRLKVICNEVECKFEDEAITTIAKFSKGGLRDAISLLDQCIVFGDGEISQEGVLELLGKNSDDVLYAIASFIIEQNALECIKLIDDICENGGKNCSVLSGEIVDYFRKLIMAKMGNGNYEDKVISQSKKASNSLIARVIKLISNGMLNMKYMATPIVMLEIAIMDICTPQISDDNLAIMQRIEKIEDDIKKGIIYNADAKPKKQSELQDIPDIQEIDVSLRQDQVPPWEDDMVLAGAIYDEPENHNVGMFEDIPPWEENSFVEQKVIQDEEKKEPAKNESLVSKPTEEKIDNISNEFFGNEQFEQMMKLLGKEYKAVQITAKSSGANFGSFENDTLTIICTDKNDMFSKALDAKKDCIIDILNKMGFKDCKVCVKIGEVKEFDNTKAVLDMFGKENVKIID